MITAYQSGVVFGWDSTLNRKDFAHEYFVLDNFYLSSFLQFFEVIDFEEFKVVNELLLDHLEIFKVDESIWVIFEFDFYNLVV